MNRILIAASAVLLVVSCAKEQPLALREFWLDASMPSADTKTSLGAKSGDAYPVLWNEGDVITVNGVSSSPLTASQAGSNSARFYFSEGVRAPFRIEYGSDIPAVQPYVEGNISSGCAPMAAESSQSAFTMKHLSCVVSFTLTGSVSVAGLSLNSLDGTLLCGSGNSIHMTVPGGGVSLSGGRTFCFAVNPATYSKGMTLDIYTTTGSRMIITAFIGKRLAAGRVYEFGSQAFAANAEDVIPIASWNDLRSFAGQTGSNNNKEWRARLLADIEVPASFTGNILESGWQADLDGGGYTISGVRKAIVHELVGSIRNLNVEGIIAVSGSSDIVSDDSQYWAGMIANRVYTGGLIENCTVRGSVTYNQWGKNVAVGAVAGYASRGAVRGCVNEAAVTTVGDGSYAVYAGGIVGYTYASSEVVTISGCTNKGTVSVKGSIKGASAAGIVGNMGTAHTSIISGSVNEGEVAVEQSATVSGELRMGGIAGYSANAIRDCTNRGVVRQSASSASIQNIGGIAGSVITDNVSGCANSGAIILNGASASAAVRCGGILGFATGDSSVSAITVSGCLFSGSISVDIASHSTINAKAITGLYSISSYSEPDCSSSGIIDVK